MSTANTTSPPGKTIEFGKYRLRWLLGQGGMAELYIAQFIGIEGFEKVVALKRILPSMTADASFVQMFLDEARLASKLDHPNIVRISDLGEVDGQFFMAMEYLPGEDLRETFDRLREQGQQFPIDMVLAVVHEAALALDFAHRLTDARGVPLGLVHRDVSPSNIIVTYHGAVKLVDFGIAKATTSSVVTNTGSFKGKLPYASPEQLRNQPLDRRADVFGLGIVLWELLAGRRLFSTSNYASTIEAVTRAEIPLPSKLRPEVSPALDAVVLRALARDREERFQSALEVQQALEGQLESTGGLRTSRQIGSWLEATFGTARADAKRALAQGKYLDQMIEGVTMPLRSNPLVRERWGQSSDPGLEATAASPGTISHPGSGSGERPAFLHPPGDLSLGSGRDTSSGGLNSQVTAGGAGRATAAGAGLAIALAVGLIGFGLWSVRFSGSGGKEVPRSASRFATIDIDSEPHGAEVFLEGEPTGLATPASLSVSADKPVHIRLEKPGFIAARDEIALQPGQTEKRTLHLTAEQSP